jgi:hypothetical protein
LTLCCISQILGYALFSHLIISEIKVQFIVNGQW